MGWQIVKGESYIVQVTFNDTEGDPGEVLCGPFLSKAEAEDFAENWGADSTEIEDVAVQFLNSVKKVTDE
jgi:hypothetical protein